jgi:tubulin polyglutamylase TTLL11
MQPYILYNYKTAFEGKPAKCFHCLGFDILLDKKGKPWLLEVNANPSFNTDHEIYESTGKTTTTESSLDKYVKAKVVGDSI